MKPIRRHLNYANIVATLALLFAMSGGALAANHYLINSTKQINPKVLKKLKGNRGPRGSGVMGQPGPRGNSVVGPQGPQGPKGTDGAKGETGQPGISDVQIVQGPDVSNPHGTQVLASAFCPSGTKAIGGGGGGTSVLPDQSINSSFPRGDDEGWNVEENNSSTTNDYKAFAEVVCATVAS